MTKLVALGLLATVLAALATMAIEVVLPFLQELDREYRRK